MKIIAARRKIFFALIALIISFSVLFLPTNSALAATTYKMTTTADVNVRTTDSTSGKVIGFYKKGTTITFTAKTKNNWYKTSYKGKTGYVSGKCVTTYKAPVATSTQSFTSLNNEARKHLGKRYKMGATGPSCFDCSGYTQYVYSKGIKKAIPRTAKQQYASAKKIKASELKNGDLIFFNYGKGIAHVGIYVGNGKMLNAQNNGVKYDTIKSGYWKKYIAGYGRVANLK
ncbi:SH3 domain-containing protein [Listeria sp. FSL L7-0091]|uniref:SH3 domain-containing protein n=1 Tax=Listeria farberi TaxID=2713500 RepID=A0A7X0ZJD3_9LIST|nr:NlpC/P60 family protein [Listeria farberi]MBC1376246.1 SH3 domain-containing protein [Listeria farberi]MBC1380137.1 SH3 domain-containing protein [Listeria farberi]MBC2262066.1 SH3 domain-containing protein [Listeria farberi]MBC2266368.1 SH3 domain-containing protein [Listeria farberi]MBC2288256.1 SH3 domain-containing protein [Listeria farberi]